MPNSATSKMSLLRALPSVDQLLRTEWATAVRSSVGAERITALARTVTEELRREIQTEALADPDAEQTPAHTREALLDEAVRRLDDAWKRDRLSGLRRVINATGVIVHTNLGRAPLSEAARSALVREAGGYCNVEYDVTTGTRGRRGARVEDLLIELTGAEDALVVNNCAAAALLILTVLAKDGETCAYINRIIASSDSLLHRHERKLPLSRTKLDLRFTKTRALACWPISVNMD